MNIAVMQPYFFPYIGYFQLINAVDKFVFYDDVNYIKQGWINRNRILVNKSDFMVTVPIEKADSFKLINETRINTRLYNTWKEKLLVTLNLNYKKAPYFDNTYNLIREVLEGGHDSISNLAIASVTAVSDALGINTRFTVASKDYCNKGLPREERLIDICKTESAKQYINASGGEELYSKESFEKQGIQLDFIKSLPIQYSQFSGDFVPWLSIIDVMMFNSEATVHTMLKEYQLK